MLWSVVKNHKMQKKRSVVVKKETIARERKKHNATIVPHNLSVVHFLFGLLHVLVPLFSVSTIISQYYVCDVRCARDYSVDCSARWRCCNLFPFILLCVRVCVCVCAHLVYGICVVGQFTTIFMMAIKNCSPLLCVWNTRILYEISRTWLPMDSVLSPCLTPSHDIFWDFRCIVKLNLIAI